jgi:ribose transport system permease protein
MIAGGTQSTAGGLLVLTAVSWLIYQTLGDGFLSSFNLFTLSQLAAETAIIGFSQLVVVVVGRLNLAVGAIGVVVVMSTGWMVGVASIPPLPGLLLGLVLGGALGALLGVLELITGLSSFIVTLAMSSIYIGVVLIASGGAAISSIPPVITNFSNDILLSPALSQLVVPALVITALLWVLYHRSTWGWKMLALGANQRAAELSGVRVSSLIVGSFALSGVLAAVAALIEMSRVASSLPSLGVGWLLSSLVVPILGGTALVGGSVSIGGALVAALFIESINSGLVSLNVPAYWQQFAQSIVLLIAVIADQTRRTHHGRPTLPEPNAPVAAPALTEGGARRAI